jgi:dTDP-4-dehydrorhamnose reductase/beta-phosphoglucomutase-like phosphatase (HAD superfamily)
MRILVCGGSGLVGKSIMKIFKNNNIDVIGTFNKKKSDDLIYIDFLNINEIENEFNKLKPDVCISCIAERENDKCESDWNNIKKVNIDITFNIAKICEKKNIFFIHLSTDYVYDGISPPFSPESETNPLQNYGISKLISEKRIISVYKNNDKYLILRIPVLYSDIQYNLNESAVTSITYKVINKIETFKEDNYSIRHPLFIDDLSYFLLNKCICGELRKIHCFYNPYDSYTKYNISELIGKILNKNIKNIVPTDHTIYNDVLRPYDTFLHDKDVEEYINNNNITKLTNGLEKALNKLVHPNINLNTTYNNNIFFVLDLDGTLVDSEKIQWMSYRDSLKDFNIEYDFETFTKICHNGDIKDYLYKNYNFTNEQFNIMKNNKKKYMNNYKNELKLINGADIFIKNIIDNNINHCVVTNSSIDTVNLYIECIPELKKIKNWIYREHYINPKPSSECYDISIEKFYNNEKYIIGFENSLCGLKSIENITKIIYFVTYKEYIFYNQIKKEDIFIIKDFYDI